MLPQKLANTKFAKLKGEKRYKSIPKWVINNLYVHLNCFVGENLYKRIVIDLNECLDNKYQVRNYENGRIISIK